MALPQADSALGVQQRGTGTSGELLPALAATVSMMSLYDGMMDVDYLTAAWWYRLHVLNGGGAARSSSGGDPQWSVLSCLQYAQHGQLLRALEGSLDQLAAQPPQQQHFGSSARDCPSPSNGGGSASAVPGRTGVARSTTTTTSPGFALNPSLQLSEHINKSKLQEYCLRYVFVFE